MCKAFLRRWRFGDMVADSLFLDDLKIRFFRLIAMLMAAMAISFAPGVAHAEYLNASVNTVASIQTTGSMHIVEQRTLHFDEDYAALAIRFTGLPSDAEIAIASVRVAHVADEGVEGEWVSLMQDSLQSVWRDAFKNKSALSLDDVEAELKRGDKDQSGSPSPQSDGWALDERASTLYVFYPFSGQMLVEVDAVIANSVFVYDDVAELYWDYVSENYSAPTENVSVSVQLPVPEGVLIDPGKNVLAWGHGPEGVVDITEAGTIEYTVAKLAEGQYAQAHILFPQSWLTNLPREMEIAYSGTRRDAAIASELAWTDTWSNSIKNSITIDLVLLCISFLSILLALVLYLVFGRERGVSRGADESGIANVNPAVMGRLARFNHISFDDFVASLMSLTDKGAIQIERVDPAEGCGFDVLGKEYGDIVIRTAPSGKSALSSDVDRESMRVLFGVLGEGYQKISVGEILRQAKSRPTEFKDAFDGWQRVLSDEVDRLALFDTRSKKIGVAMIVACVVFAVLALICVLNGRFVAAAAMFASFVCLGIVGNYMPRRQGEGILLAEEFASLKSSIESRTSVDGSVIEPYVATLFACGVADGLARKVSNPTEEETLWILPVHGRGGKAMSALSRRLSVVLDEAYLEACSR